MQRESGQVLARLTPLVPLTLAGLQLVHPFWVAGSVYQAVAPVVDWWLVVHLLMSPLFLLLAWVLARDLRDQASGFATAARWLVAALGAFNSLFLAVDGIGTGVLVRSGVGQDPGQQALAARAATGLWESFPMLVLANLAGASWALGLIGYAVALYPAGRKPVPLAGLALTLLLFLPGAFAPALPFGWPGGLARVAAILTGALVAYDVGARALPFALLVFAAVVPQHVGVQAALGVACVFLALAGRELIWHDNRPRTGRPPRSARRAAARASR